MTDWSRREFIAAVGAAGTTAALLGPQAVAQAGRAPSLRFGVQTPPQQTTYKDLLSVWKEADDLGFDSVFAFDHFMPIMADADGPCFEGWTLLAALATQTRRIRVGLLVTGNTYRFPAVLAKSAITVDHACNGRLILGIGAGWFEREHTAYGIPFYTPGGRARRLRESVEVLKALFTQPRTTYKGKYYTLTDAPCEPKAIQRPHPPILIGGMGPKVVQPVAARHAQIWHFFVRDGDPEKVKEVCRGFDEICHKVGRDPAEVEKAMSLRAADLTGSSKEIRMRVQALADAGVRHLVLQLAPPFDRALLRRFAKEVMGGFRASR